MAEENESKKSVTDTIIILLRLYSSLITAETKLSLQSKNTACINISFFLNLMAI